MGASQTERRGDGENEAREGAQRMIEVLEGGIQTTVQDFPGRQGLLDQGICPAGPFDNLAFRLANLLVGNDPGTAGLEITAGNFQARFDADAVIALTGANMQPKLDGEPIDALAVVSRHARPDPRPGQRRRRGISHLPGGERRHRRAALPR